MKKVLFIILSFSLIYLAGCSGDGPVDPISLYDFIGDWYMEGTLDSSIEEREFAQDVETIIFIREGHVTDNFGYTYDISFEKGILRLSRDLGFSGKDMYCGNFNGGTEATFVFPNINPSFDQFFTGTTSGETAVFTEHCGYKTLKYHGTVLLFKVD